MVSWAKYTKQVADAAGKPVPIPKQFPWPDRKRLLPEGGPPLELEEIAAVNKTLDGYLVLDPTDPEKMVDDIGNLFAKADVSDASPDQLEYFMEPTTGIWRFTPSKLRDLVEAVKRVDPNTRMSTYDIVTAFIWQRFYMAKRGKKRDVPPTAQIVTALDVRRKLNPPLPATYLGACVDLVTVTVDSNIFDPKIEFTKGVSEIAKNVRGFGTAWSEKKYMEILSLAQRAPMCPGLIPVGPIDMLATDHAGFGHGVKASWGGELGLSAAHREPYISRETPRGEVIFLPRQPNGDLDILISAEEIVLERLLGDVVMSSTCENICVRHNVLESFATIGMKRAKL